MAIKDISVKLKWLTGLTLATVLLTIAIVAIWGKFWLAEDYQILIRRFPYILIGNQNGWAIKGGFAINIFISLVCTAVGTILGTFLGLAQLAPERPIRSCAWLLTQFFRNSPWLVILFVMFYLLPFEVSFGWLNFQFSPIAKSIIGLSLVLAANISEIVRGGIRSIPSGQWEAAMAMGYTRRQILWLIVMPQAVRRMIPPWMNWYAILTMGTTLTNLVGVPEGLTAVREVLALEGERLAIPLYAFLMLLFFIYCYPIAWGTKKLERRFNYYN
jgi:polar amino acid transport system permease protein